MGHKKGDPGQKAHAAYMKAKGITRKTGSCPMGCSATIPNGGPALLAHLIKCTGPK